MKRKEICSYLMFFICIFMIQCLYFYLFLNRAESNTVYLILGIVFLCTCFQLYQLILKTLDRDKIGAELSALKAQQKMEEEQELLLAERQGKTVNLQNSLYSDLQEVENLLREEAYPQAHQKLAVLTASFEKERFRPYCEDNLIHAILDGKKVLAEKNNIQVSFEILLPKTTEISTVDLSSVLFNLMDNGIEACCASECSDPEIKLSVKEMGGFLLIHMINSKNPNQQFDQSTTKEDSDMHGFGLSIIQDICRNYDGSCRFEDKGDTFVTVILMNNIR